MKELKIRITILESVLGTQTGDKDIYRNFIGSKAPDSSTVEDEVMTYNLNNEGSAIMPEWLKALKNTRDSKE